MKRLLNQIRLTNKYFDHRYVQLLFVILTLLMLVLGAGAPFGHGGH